MKQNLNGALALAVGLAFAGCADPENSRPEENRPDPSSVQSDDFMNRATPGDAYVETMAGLIPLLLQAAEAGRPVDIDPQALLEASRAAIYLGYQTVEEGDKFPDLPAADRCNFELAADRLAAELSENLERVADPANIVTPGEAEALENITGPKRAHCESLEQEANYSTGAFIEFGRAGMQAMMLIIFGPEVLDPAGKPGRQLPPAPPPAPRYQA